MNFSIGKNNINKESSIRPLYKDIFCIIILLALNPITYFIQLSPGIFPPDFFAYATMARDLFHKGLLYLPSWGHVDTALILPPLYPFLIALGNLFSPETLAVAEIISSISMLVFSILSFFYLRMTTNRLIAIIAVTIIQLNYFYFRTGMMPLTESVFILTIGLTLLLAFLLLKNSPKKQYILSFILGVSCCLVFFSRQVGGVIYVFVAFLFLIRWFQASVTARRVLFKNFLFVVCGAMFLLVPYTVCLYMQTGQHPLTQYYKKHEYMVKVDDPQVLDKMKQETKLPAELRKYIGSQPNKDYGIIYAKRRSVRKLLPDSSEMFGNIYVEGKKNSLIKKAASNFIDPGKYSKRLSNNISHLITVLGLFTTALFFLTCILAPIIKSDSERNPARFILPSFIIIYLLVISLFTDRIARYIYVIFPFCIMHISIEMYRYFKRTERVFRREWPGFLLLAVVFPSILLTTPGFFTELPLKRKFRIMDNEYLHEFNNIVTGEPVFSLFALEACLIGSPYRYLPNDSLEKLAVYGKKTGVRWILIYHGRSTANELTFYTNLGWYSYQSLEKKYPDIVKCRYATKDGTMALYEIL